MVFAAYYWPGYKAGGPIRTIRNMVASLRNEFDFRIVTSDRDYGDPEPFTSVAVNRWNSVDGAQVYYADKSRRGMNAIAGIIRSSEPDIVHLNSFFSPEFTTKPLLARRLGLVGSKAGWIIAPRGECAESALALKARKKKAFITVSGLTGLHRDITWQASSLHESENIQRQLGIRANAIRVAPNLTEPAGEFIQPSGSDSPSVPLRVCFLSRICPMKNLAFALEVLKQVRRPVEFNIYGPVEDETYAASCRRIADASEGRLQVSWLGQVPHDEVREVLRSHDLFLLPTLGENFGHVIFESLAAGTPVLISDRTPWRDLDEKGAGWVRSLDSSQPFADVVEEFAATPLEQRNAMRRRAHKYASDMSLSSSSLEANRQLFYSCVRR